MLFIVTIFVYKDGQYTNIGRQLSREIDTPLHLDFLIQCVENVLNKKGGGVVPFKDKFDRLKLQLLHHNVHIA